MLIRVGNFSELLQAVARSSRSLSHPARPKILKTLARKGALSCGEIVKAVGLAQSTTSQHLKELVNSGLIRVETEGLRSLYSVDERAVRRMISDYQEFFRVVQG